MLLGPTPTPRSLGAAIRLVRALADGLWHSPEEVARSLGLSWSEVMTAAADAAALARRVEVDADRGLRLDAALDLLDKDAILAHVDPHTASRLRALEVHSVTDSTNDRVLAAADAGAGHAHACLAEFQTAGRGRRGRRWIAPFGSGICVSVGWHLPDVTGPLAAISLAAGVAVLEVVRRVGVAEAGLKWPNDLVWRGRKLGGILTELRSLPNGGRLVVAGVGLNVQLPDAIGLDCDPAPVDLYSALSQRVSRNALAASLVGALIRMFESFAASGLEPFLGPWRAADVVAGREVTMQLPQETRRGIARGVAEDGALIVDVDGKLERYNSGEISVSLFRDASG